MNPSPFPPSAVPVSRAQFLRLAVAFGITLAGSKRAAAADDAHEIAPGAFVHTGIHGLASPANGGDICNCSFVVGSEAVAVIDTGGSAKIGAALKAAIAARTGLPIRYVINTHMHPDHVLGNVAFAADGVTFVAHHKMARALAERGDTYLEAAREQLGEAGFAGTRIVLPTQGVESETVVDLGGRSLTLRARPTAHTNNDLTVRDSKSDTLFLGDLLFAEHVPTIDGSLRGWLQLLPVLEAEGAARVVPGHGPPAMPWPQADIDLKRYLETLAQDVRAEIAAGHTMTQAIETAGRSESGKWQLFADHHARNVSAAFAELEWE